MNNNSVFRKSAKGAEAIATRQHGLGPRQRSMLIMINGKRSVEELSKMSAMFPDPLQLLSELEAGGFIEAEALPPPPSAAPASAPSPMADAPPAQQVAGRVPLAEAKRFAVRKLTDLMGPMADSLCMRLESARNVDEYNAMIDRIEAVLRETRGANAASGYIQSLSDHRPLGP